MFKTRWSKVLIKLIGIVVLYSLIGCTMNSPELKSVKGSNGKIAVNYNIAKLNDTPPSANKIVVEKDQIDDALKTKAPVLKINQQWTYFNHDLNTTKTMIVKEANTDYYIIEDGTDEIKYDKNMKIIDIIHPSSKDHEKHWVKYNFPMYVGKQWEYEAYFKHSSSDKLYKALVNSEVISYGNVSVKAGMFKAFKIHEQVNYQSNLASSYYWYAPEVGVIIKSVPRSKISMVPDIELISYTK